MINRSVILSLILASALVPLSFSRAEEIKSADQTISSVQERLKKLQEQSREAAAPTPAQTETAAPTSDSEGKNETPPPPKKKEKKKKRKAKARSKSPEEAEQQAKHIEKLAAEPRPPQRSATRETQEIAPVPESPQEEETRLTKNWGGARKTLSDHGIDIALIYKGEFNRNFSGGIRRASTYLGNMDFRVSMDGEKLAGWKGGSAFLYILGDHGGDPSKNVGDAQVTSNIETAVNTVKVYEAWIQQLGFDDRVSLLVGLHDLNSEFYVTDSTALFFNSTFGVGKDLSQTGVNGPSIFPTPSTAIRLRAEPSKDFYLQFGIFNARAGDPGNPYGTKVRLNAGDGFLLITEAAFLRGKLDAQKYPGKYGVGIWNYTRTFDSQTNTVTDSSGNSVPARNTSHGAYFLAEQAVRQDMTLFARYGVASTEVNRFGNCLGTGVVMTGLVPHRPKDRFGVAMARVENGGEYKTSLQSQGLNVAGAETTYEANYRIEVIPGFAVQPDLQYVIHPMGDPVNQPNLANATVGAVRFEFNF